MATIRRVAGLVLWTGVAVSLAFPVRSASPEEQDASHIADLVTANHILAAQGIVDGFGHISVRSVKNPNHYFISRSKAPALVTADARLESEALELGGKITLLNETEAAKIGEINDQQVDRPWDLWKRNAQAQEEKQ